MIIQKIRRKPIYNILVMLMLTTSSALHGKAPCPSHEDIFVNGGEIVYVPLKDFIKQSIIPLAKLNHFNPKRDMITITQTTLNMTYIPVEVSENYYISQLASDLPPNGLLEINITVDCVYPPASIYPYQDRYYGIDIDGIRIYYRRISGDIRIIKSTGRKLYVGNDNNELAHLMICDDCFSLTFDLSEDFFRYTDMEDWGCIWLQNPESLKYLPSKAITILPSELRKLPDIEVTTTPKPIEENTHEYSSGDIDK